jgi:hypothetical protein
MDPQSQGLLDKYTLVLKKIIYDADRMRQFMKMMGTVSGTIAAVKAVIGAIDMKKPIPPQIRPLVAINAYILMADLAQEATGRKIPPEAMKKVIAVLANDHGAQMTDGAPAAPAQAAPAATQPGIIQRAMGAA